MPKNVHLSKALIVAIATVLRGSHATLDDVFLKAGAPGPPPELSHGRKWREWISICATNPECDTLAVLGSILEEFMDIEPTNPEFVEKWKVDRERVARTLEDNGLQYYPGGRIIPNDEPQPAYPIPPTSPATVSAGPRKPSTLDELLLILLKNVHRAMHPLTHRRKGAVPLTFSSEYDIQDLLHALLRPWVTDIRPEEFTPSYAGSSARMDFLLPAHKTVIETKLVRDAAHAKRIGDELIIDIDHYRKHPGCDILWCVVYDPEHLIRNPESLKDLEGVRTSKDRTVEVKVLVVV